MEFKKYFKDEEVDQIEDKQVEESIELDDTLKKIRKSVKIKQIVPTKFGIEVKLFNAQDAQDAAKIAGTKKIDGSSIFID